MTDKTVIPILFQDVHIAACVKPAGIDAQNAVPALLRQTLGGEFFCIHRLDRDVGGVMLYARTAAAAAALSRQIAAGAMEKTYLAVCAGHPIPQEGEMRDLLFHDTSRNKTYVVNRMRKGVREAALRYKTLMETGDAALVRTLLLTGRTHQIRVQFASRGMPLLGDAKYGSRRRDCPIALWSAEIRVSHPVNGAPLCFSAPPPKLEPWNTFEKGGALFAEFQTGAVL